MFQIKILPKGCSTPSLPKKNTHTACASSDLLIAQLVERQTSIHEVVGSSPTPRTHARTHAHTHVHTICTCISQFHSLYISYT